MARNLMAEEGSERLMLRALLTGGLIYSLPMLVEVRLSPQINVWIYGYFAHDFGQMMRYGGYRPMVFMTHGLWVALFACMAVLAAAVRLRDPAGFAEAQAHLLAQSVGALQLLTIAQGFDADFETLHPWRLRRVTLGPIHSREFTLQEGFIIQRDRERGRYFPGVSSSKRIRGELID